MNFLMNTLADTLLATQTPYSQTFVKNITWLILGDFLTQEYVNTHGLVQVTVLNPELTIG